MSRRIVMSETPKSSTSSRTRTAPSERTRSRMAVRRWAASMSAPGRPLAGSGETLMIQQDSYHKSTQVNNSIRTFPVDSDRQGRRLPEYVVLCAL